MSHHGQAATGGRGQCGEPRHDYLYYEVQVQNRLSNEYVPLHVINYRVSQKKWGFVFWATFEGVKWPQTKKFKIRDPH